MDRILSSNSLVTDGKSLRVAAADLANRFIPQALTHDADGAIGVAGESQQGVTGKPHILLATTGLLPSTARLAMELSDAGATVSLIAPRAHPARVLKLFDHSLIYHAATQRRCLKAALLQVQPDMVIPCDERTVRDLQAIALTARTPELRRLIERSTAPLSSFAVITSRAALLARAEQEGVRVPPSMPLPDNAALDRWAETHDAPFVLKADGSWAGFGVRIVSHVAAANEAYKRMTRPAGVRVALRESLFERNYFEIRSWLRRDRPTLSVQGFIDGSPANIGVACWQGEVLAATCAAALATTSATGPSTAARIIQNTEMLEAATKVVRALRLSGMIGFDFMIEEATGAAYMIEMNPRNTPICPVRLGPGRDLPEALVARLAGRPVRERPARTDRDIVVFFPDTWQDDPASDTLRTGFHDVPWEEPALVRALTQPKRRDRHSVFRLMRRAYKRVRADADSKS
jgi:hypothetical protein